MRMATYATPPVAMLVVLSPAKTLDLSACAVAAGIKASTPGMLTAAHQLLPALQSKSRAELRSLFGVSDAIATLNHERFRDFHSLPTKPAVFAFDGPAYKGLSATTLSVSQRDYCQQHLCVLNSTYPPPAPLLRREGEGSEMGAQAGTRG